MKEENTTKGVSPTTYIRQEYMANKCTHREYYGQFVTEITKELVLKFIGLSAILNSKDEHFNDIPLAAWDFLCAGGIPRAKAFKDVGDIPSLAGNVCIAKEAARQIKEANS